MHRNAGCFTNGVKPRNDHFGIIAHFGYNLSMIITRNAAHIIVDSRCHRQWLTRKVDTRKNLSAFRNAGQTLRQYRGIDMVEVKVDMVLVRTYTAAFAHF